MLIDYLDEQLFDASKWRSGTPQDLGLICRSDILISNKITLREYAVGYCDADKLICRPKVNNKAIMFYKNGVYFWFHITNYEFNKIFKE
ncbi:MAG: hypothetical protein WCW65_03200 [Candidatus Paceibacterota bacterium]